MERKLKEKYECSCLYDEEGAFGVEKIKLIQLNIKSTFNNQLRQLANFVIDSVIPY